ncbi:MAG: L-histidine N(alpha)-methyltransferase, partial [Ginsengibacter sp.]
MKEFRTNVIKGLQSTPKHLHSKYLYDKRGDELFQKIMNC